MTSFSDELSAVPLGEYLRIWGKFPGSINPQCYQGKLKSVDVKAGVAKLESTVYEGRIDEVPIDKITGIEYGRSGSGASGSVLRPDKVYNPTSGEYQDKTYKS
ncbi:hypothetical protein D3C81_1855100 [compost metagenome]